MKRADFEAMRERLVELAIDDPVDHHIIAAEIDRAVRKARKEEREKATRELEELRLWRRAYKSREDDRK